LLQQQRSNQADDGIIVREYTDDIRSPLDFAVQSFDGVRRLQLGAVFLGKNIL
jgi:hypothetical protein